MNAKTALIAASMVAGVAASPIPSGSALSTDHAHGIAIMDLEIRGDHLQIDLISPGEDILGFEKDATTKREQQKLRETMVRLANPDTFMAMPPASQCTIAGIQVEVESKNDQHEHTHNFQGIITTDHNIIHANYIFHCQKINRLDSIDVHLMRIFPKAERIDGTAQTARGKRQFKLDKNASNIYLTGLN